MLIALCKDDDGMDPTPRRHHGLRKRDDLPASAGNPSLLTLSAARLSGWSSLFIASFVPRTSSWGDLVLGRNRKLMAARFASWAYEA